MPCCARMAELADATDSKPVASDGMWVRSPLRAPLRLKGRIRGDSGAAVFLGLGRRPASVHPRPVMPMTRARAITVRHAYDLRQTALGASMPAHPRRTMPSRPRRSPPPKVTACRSAPRARPQEPQGQASRVLACALVLVVVRLGVDVPYVTAICRATK